ncbi:MAG TPA: hypothetical protein VK420_15625 [Longimicrobium sp.]|nr:hypothetical protein [Longimicrobium sp.]
MSTFLWIVVGVALVAGALLLASARLRGGSTLPARAAPPIAPAWTTNSAGAADVFTVRLAREDLKLIQADIQYLHGIRDDIRHVADLLQQGLSGALATEQTRGDAPPPQPSGGGRPDAYRDAGRNSEREPAATHGAAWRDDARDLGLHVQRDEFVWGSDPTPALADPAWSAPAAAQPHEPSPAAEPVEASNDAVISSQRHPPEAWLERKGGESEVWLNARVTLTDAGLQRWSTFFDWERREPGARYQTTRPARVTSSGGLVSKGVARPL